MDWLLKVADETKIQVQLNGKSVLLDIHQLNSAIKKRLQSSRAIRSLFEEFEVSLDRLDDLIIEVGDLDKKYAETDGERMMLNKTLFEGGRFFEDYFFVVCHEIVHWLSRQKEQDSYFNDPEEVLGFVSSIAYEMESETSFDDLWNKVYNKISWHFHNEEDARDFFGNMMTKAKKLLAKSALS